VARAISNVDDREKAWTRLSRTGGETTSVNNASISLAALTMAVLFCSTRACPSLDLSAALSVSSALGSLSCEE
jgi:hypothetical protein